MGESSAEERADSCTELNTYVRILNCKLWVESKRQNHECAPSEEEDLVAKVLQEWAHPPQTEFTHYFDAYFQSL